MHVSPMPGDARQIEPVLQSFIAPIVFTGPENELSVSDFPSILLRLALGQALMAHYLSSADGSRTFMNLPVPLLTALAQASNRDLRQ